jgi:hypothetical protein
MLRIESRIESQCDRSLSEPVRDMPSLRMIQLHSRSPDAQNNAAISVGITDHVWTVRDPRKRSAHEDCGHVYVVGYVINVYQKYAGSVPTLRFAKGHLTGIRAGDLVHAMLHASLDLELEGTRHVQVSLRTLDGDSM